MSHVLADMRGKFNVLCLSMCVSIRSSLVVCVVGVVVEVLEHMRSKFVRYVNRTIDLIYNDIPKQIGFKDLYSMVA